MFSVHSAGCKSLSTGPNAAINTSIIQIKKYKCPQIPWKYPDQGTGKQRGWVVGLKWHFRETLEHFLVAGERREQALLLGCELIKLQGFPWPKRKADLYYKGKITECTGLPNIEKVNHDNSPGSDEHRGGTWGEKRWGCCQKSWSSGYLISLADYLKSASFLRAVLPHSWVTEVMPRGGKILHISHPDMPNRQGCLFLPVAMQDQLSGIALSTLIFLLQCLGKNFQGWTEGMGSLEAPPPRRMCFSHTSHPTVKCLI